MAILNILRSYANAKGLDFLQTEQKNRLMRATAYIDENLYFFAKILNFLLIFPGHILKLNLHVSLIRAMRDLLTQ